LNLNRFVAEREADWTELEQLVHRAHGQNRKLTPTQVHRVGALYRSAAADLAVARRSFPDASGTLRLQSLVADAYGLVYSKATREATAWEFLSTDMWRKIRATGGCLALSIAIMAGFTVLGAIWALFEPTAAAGLLPSAFHASAHSGKGSFFAVSLVGRGGLAVAIFVNNIEVAIMALAGGFTFGVLTAYSLAYNGATLGILGALEWRAGSLGQFVSLIAPHGLLELSCISIAGATGLMIARTLVDPGDDTRPAAVARLLPTLGASILAVMLFLVVAGLTEGLLTPDDLPPVVAVGVGVVLAGGFWALVAWRGRDRPRP
jgi:uncharacterized membrane protein SpoIIM required for sporulation